MTTLDKLKSAKSLTDVAMMIGFTPAGLSYALYRIPPTMRYSIFTIPKRDGSARTIHAPAPQLKLAQRRLANVLYQCRSTIEGATPRRSLSHGFRRSHSIVTNAKPHKGRRFVLNLDLEDFFPSFNFGRVRGYFLKNRDFALHDKVATVIAQIACHDNALPQGSPCSPVIAELLAHLLDVRMAALAKANGATYSRYADDLTFSSGRRQFANDLAHRDDEEGSEWRLGDPLRDAIARAGFRVNDAKTRMQCRPSRQTVTGLTVNLKVNVRAEYYKDARSMCYELFRTGSYHRREQITLPGGTPAFARIEDLAPLEGILSHVHHVKSASDTRGPAERRNQHTAAEVLYQRFLFYRHFVALEKPLVVCEGPTDNIYLRTALRQLTAFHPRLGAWSVSAFVSALSFFRYSKTAREVLDLTGGTGDLATFIGRYGQTLSRFGHKPLRHPVIVLIDNDDGAKKILPMLAKKLGTAVTLSTDDPFYHYVENLYVVKTPAMGAKGDSCIESLFDPSVLKTPLKGKSFQPNGSIDKDKEYGKAAFAENVILPNATTIDFSNFAQILERFVAVLDDYKPPVSAAAPTVGAASAAA